jgi:hypothetical protein
MRLSLKIREAKKHINVCMDSHDPLYFGNSQEYRDFIINQIIYAVHGINSSESHLLIYYEYRKRFAEKIEGHFNYI